jgi:hypothetical protein
MPVTTFTYDESLLEALTKSLSAPRLRPYLAKTQTKEKAIELYIWNTQISEALFSPLQGFEVAIRNSIDVQLAIKHGDDWYKHPTVFLEEQKDKIDKVLRNFDKDRAICRPDVVSRLSFGFWADILYYEVYEELWRQVLNKAFPEKPKGTMRKHVGPRVENLRKLRNRIAHHEPIFSRPLPHDYQEILEIASWICPKTSLWIAHQNRFSEVMAIRPF